MQSDETTTVKRLHNLDESLPAVTSDLFRVYGVSETVARATWSILGAHSHPPLCHIHDQPPFFIPGLIGLLLKHIHSLLIMLVLIC